MAFPKAIKVTTKKNVVTRAFAAVRVLASSWSRLSGPRKLPRPSKKTRKSKEQVRRMTSDTKNIQSEKGHQRQKRTAPPIRVRLGAAAANCSNGSLRKHARDCVRPSECPTLCASINIIELLSVSRVHDATENTSAALGAPGVRQLFCSPTPGNKHHKLNVSETTGSSNVKHSQHRNDVWVTFIADHVIRPRQIWTVCTHPVPDGGHRLSCRGLL